MAPNNASVESVREVAAVPWAGADQRVWISVYNRPQRSFSLYLRTSAGGWMLKYGPASDTTWSLAAPGPGYAAALALKPNGTGASVIEWFGGAPAFTTAFQFAGAVASDYWPELLYQSARLQASSGTHAVLAATLPRLANSTSGPFKLVSWLRSGAAWAPLPEVASLTLGGVRGLTALPSGSALVGNPTEAFGVRRLQ